jgi:uncharacterized membrane protein YeaQ/YmgE (transglycosylase-associated protein family)
MNVWSLFGSLRSLIILGLFSGFIASKIVNGTGEGILMDVVRGIIGAIVGEFLFAQFGRQEFPDSISTACFSR